MQMEKIMIERKDVINFIKENSYELPEIIIEAISEEIHSDCNYVDVDGLNGHEHNLVMLYMLATRIKF